MSSDNTPPPGALARSESAPAPRPTPEPAARFNFRPNTLRKRRHSAGDVSQGAEFAPLDSAPLEPGAAICMDAHRLRALLGASRNAPLSETQVRPVGEFLSRLTMADLEVASTPYGRPAHTKSGEFQLRVQPTRVVVDATGGRSHPLLPAAVTMCFGVHLSAPAAASGGGVAECAHTLSETSGPSEPSEPTEPTEPMWPREIWGAFKRYSAGWMRCLDIEARTKRLGGELKEHVGPLSPQLRALIGELEAAREATLKALLAEYLALEALCLAQLPRARRTDLNAAWDDTGDVVNEVIPYPISPALADAEDKRRQSRGAARDATRYQQSVYRERLANPASCSAFKALVAGMVRLVMVRTHLDYNFYFIMVLARYEASGSPAPSGEASGPPAPSK